MTKNGNRYNTRRSDQGLVTRVNVTIPKELHAAFAQLCKTQAVSLSRAVTEMMRVELRMSELKRLKWDDRSE